jgi:hypothetical protein
MKTNDIYTQNLDDIFLGVLIGIGISAMVFVIINYTGLNLSKAIPLISLIGTVIAVSMGLWIFKRNSNWRFEDKKVEDSKFFLEKSLSAYNDFYELIKDRNNNRTTWIMASRILEDADKLSKNIYHEPHKVYFDAKILDFKHKTFKILTILNPDTEEYEPLPAQFFFGIKDWESVSIEEAARGSTSEVVATRVEKYKNPEPSKLSYLSIKSIIPIMNFLDFPENYIDPMQQYDEKDAENWSDIFGYKIGAKNYIKFRNEYYIDNADIFSKKEIIEN